MNSLRVVNEPESLPISVDDMKLYLRVDGELEDDLVESLIQAATTQIESVWAWRALIPRTYELTEYAPAGTTLGRMAIGFHLPMPPVVEVESVTVDGVERNDWTLNGELGLLIFAAPIVGTLVVEYTAGYASVIPAPFIQAIKLLVATWYENREAVTVGGQPAGMPFTIRNLLLPYRAWGAQ